MDRFLVVPYREIDGVRNYTDTFIRGLYNRMESDGTAPFVFKDGQIRSADDFLRCMKHGENILFILYVDGEVGGITWLNRFEGKLARNHFCTFSHIWGKDTEALGRFTLRHLITMKDSKDEYIWDVFMGITPVSNTLATEFVGRCGGRIEGIMPNACYDYKTNTTEDGVLTSYTRECLDEDLQGSKD